MGLPKVRQKHVQKYAREHVASDDYENEQLRRLAREHPLLTQKVHELGVRASRTWNDRKRTTDDLYKLVAQSTVMVIRLLELADADGGRVLEEALMHDPDLETGKLYVDAHEESARVIAKHRKQPRNPKDEDTA